MCGGLDPASVSCLSHIPRRMYERTQAWIDERGIFPAEQASPGRYTEAVIRLEAAE